MSKITLNDLVNLQNETTAVSTINANNAAIETAMDNTLSRDGTTPNTMGASIDLNSYPLLNAPAPVALTDVVRLQELNAVAAGGGNLPGGGTAGQMLVKNSSTAYDTSWTSPTGTGAPVKANAPTLTTPSLGVATATSVNKVAITQPATGATLTIGDNKTLSVPQSLTLTSAIVNPTITFQASDIYVGRATTDTFSNKTFDINANILNFNGLQVTRGQIPGTAANDSAATGYVGEYLQSFATGATSTVTISNSSPALITWTSHGFTAALNNYSVITFTTTGGLPTGLTVGTSYYITFVDANTLKVSTSVANAIAGTFVNTSSAGSGTHTASCTSVATTTTAIDVAGLSLTAGDWDIWGSIAFVPGATTSVTQYYSNISRTSNTLDVGLAGAFNQSSCAAQVPGGFTSVFNCGPVRQSISGTTTIFLVARSIFTVSTMNFYGSIRARRVR